ncbi:MAG: PQQ-binding-like beta-propeller repeat protein [Planctomycetota bacterium]
MNLNDNSNIGNLDDEWKIVEQRIPHQYFLLRLSARGRQVMHNGEGISAEGNTLLKLVLAQDTVEAMVQKAGFGRLITNQLLLKLWDKGLIEPMPLADYEKVARECLRLNRYEESQRIASFVAKYGESEQKEQALLTLADIEKARKSITQSNAKAILDPEVIHRSQLKLISKKKRARWPLILSIVLVAGLATMIFFLMQNTSKNTGYSRRGFDEMKGQAQCLINTDQWIEARRLINDYVTYDSKMRQEKNEFFDQKFQKPFELHLLQAITRFTTVYPNGKPNEINAAVTNLEKLLTVPVAALDIKEAVDAVILKLNRYRHDQKTMTFKTRLATIKATIKDSIPLEDAYNALLKEDPPESIADKVREDVRQLSKNRIESIRILKQCQELQKKGDLETARLELERLKTLYAGATWAETIATTLKQFAAVKDKAQTELRRIEGLRKTDQDAALIKFLDSKPPQLYAAHALDILHTLRADDPETKLMTALREAERLPAAESRLKILELVKQHPYAKASWKATLKVNVTSEPSGAEVALIGFKDEINGKTPLTLNLPVLARFSLTFKLPSFYDYEFSDFGFCGNNFSVTLNRKEVIARRLPMAARNGIGLTSDCVIVVGENELALCSRPEIKVMKRIKLPASVSGSKPNTTTTVTIIESQAFISFAKSLLRIRLPDGDMETINLSDVATSVALPTQNKKALVVATKAGWELLYSAKDNKPIWSITLAGEPVLPALAVADKAVVVGASQGDEYYLNVLAADNGRLLWRAQLYAKPVGLAADGNSIMVSTEDGELSVFDLQ